jgi:transposase
LPPAEKFISTPYDREARSSQKRSTTWTGYKVHLTETCDEEGPHLITDVQTTPATTPDFTLTPRIQSALTQRGLSPPQQILDAGSSAADHLVTSQTLYQIDMLGPVGPDNSWQSQQNAGFGAADFSLDWVQRTARCPEGHRSRILDVWGRPPEE